MMTSYVKRVGIAMNYHLNHIAITLIREKSVSLKAIAVRDIFIVEFVGKVVRTTVINGNVRYESFIYIYIYIVLNTFV